MLAVTSEIGLPQLFHHQHPTFFISMLQLVQNAAARVVHEFEEVQSCNTLSDKTALATCKTAHYLQTEPHCVQAINGDVPDYIQSLLSINQPPGPLDSGDKM